MMMITSKLLFPASLASLTVVPREIQLLGSRGPEKMENHLTKTDSHNYLAGICKSFKLSKLTQENTFAP